MDQNTYKDSTQPWQTGPLVAASLTIIHMLYNCEFLPKPLKALLPAQMTTLTQMLRNALGEMVKNPDYVPSTAQATAKGDAKERADFVLQQLTRIRDHKQQRTDSAFLEEHISQFQNMLVTFKSSVS